MQDGACTQARSVLPFINTAIQGSWSSEQLFYGVDINVGRWGDGREQGYIVHADIGKEQLNIAFLQYRYSTHISAIKWSQRSNNTLTIDDAEFGPRYKDKYYALFDTHYGEVLKMANWINNEFEDFYKNEAMK